MNIQKADSHAPIILSKKIFKELSNEGWTQQLNIYIYIIFLLNYSKTSSRSSRQNS